MSKKMDTPIVAFQCPRCGTEYFPEDLIEHAMPTPSGADVVVGLLCECGRQTLMSWHVLKWNAMQTQRSQQLAREEKREEQRERSAIGREVAAFSRRLERVSTVADIGWDT